MATLLPNLAHPSNDFVRFSIDWKIKWADFDKITQSVSQQKHFNTSCDNVVLRWSAKLTSTDGSLINDNQINFWFSYLSGPVEKLKDVDLSFAVVKPDRSTQVIRSTTSSEVNRGSAHGWSSFENNDAAKIQAKYSLSNVQLIYRITLKIPTSTFALDQEFPKISTLPNWMIDLHNVVEDPGKSSFWNAKLISNNNTVFYCHKIIGFQSKPLEAMFNHPPKEGKPENEYPFPGLATESMRVFIRYLYTGQMILGDLSIDHLIELADTSEQYNLKSLKEVCIFEMWQKVVKDPNVCFKIIQFSDLHQDMKYLKDRTLDILAENYENLEAHTKNLVQEFGGGECGEKLLQEFILFQSRRLMPYFDWHTYLCPCIC